MGNSCVQGVQTSAVAPETILVSDKLQKQCIVQPPTLSDDKPSDDERREAPLSSPRNDIRGTGLSTSPPSSIFWCIQTKSTCKWGLQHSIMQTIQELGLEVVDYRTCRTNSATPDYQALSSSIVMNEVFVKDYAASISDGMSDTRVQVIEKALTDAIRADDAQVLVQPWVPRATQSTASRSTNIIPGMTDERNNEETADKMMNVPKKPSDVPTTERRHLAFNSNGEEQQTKDTNDCSIEKESTFVESTMRIPAGETSSTDARPKRRRRVKTRSTPAFGGGGLFGEATDQAQTIFETSSASGATDNQREYNGVGSTASIFTSPQTRLGVPAKVRVKDETFGILVNSETLRALEDEGTTQLPDSRRNQSEAGVAIQAVDAPVVSKLSGYVRKENVAIIVEGDRECSSEFIVV